MRQMVLLISDAVLEETERRRLQLLVILLIRK